MEGAVMKIRFKSNQGGANGFKMNQEYEMDEKSARHWISVGAAVEVTGNANRPQQQPQPGTPAAAGPNNPPKQP
jgi:hypothetical protein